MLSALRLLFLVEGVMRRFAVDHDMIVDSGSQIPEPDALVRSQFVEREARREKSITDGE